MDLGDSSGSSWLYGILESLVKASVSRIKLVVTRKSLFQLEKKIVQPGKYKEMIFFVNF